MFSRVGSSNIILMYKLVVIRGMLDSLIDPSRSDLEPAHPLVGWIGLGPKLWLKYHACPPRGSQRHGIWGVFQVVERLAPWFVLQDCGVFKIRFCMHTATDWEMSIIWNFIGFRVYTRMVYSIVSNPLCIVYNSSFLSQHCIQWYSIYKNGL